MNVNFSLCGSLTWKCHRPKKQRERDRDTLDVQEMIVDLFTLLNDPYVEYDCIKNHFLNKVIQATRSEYGFLAAVKNCNGQSCVHPIAMSNVAWNEMSLKFYADHQKTMEHICMDHPESYINQCIYLKQPIIENQYTKKDRNICPAGHPPIKRTLCIPMVIRRRVIAILCMCNAKEKYTQRTVDLCQYFIQFYCVQNLMHYKVFVDDAVVPTL